MEAIILSGIQGAGKSTFCREHYWDSHIRINYDMLRTRHREKLLIAACIESKQSYVVDATNPTIEDRQRYIAPAKAGRFKIIGIEFQVATAVAVTRNKARTGEKKVPDIAIYATASKLQPLSFAEGFDEIWRVCVSAEGYEMKEIRREI